jgi:hypothetical protein
VDPEPFQSYELTQTSSAAVSYADAPPQSEYDISEAPAMSEAGNQAVQSYYTAQMSSASTSPPARNYSPAPALQPNMSSAPLAAPALNYTPAQSNSSSAGEQLQSIDPALGTSDENMSYADEANMSVMPDAPNIPYADQPNMSYADQPNMSVAPSGLNYTPAQPNMSYAYQPNMSVAPARPGAQADPRQTPQAGQPQQGNAPTNGQARQEGGQNTARPAGNAPAAGMPLVQAAPTPHTRGGSAASADPENAALIDQIVAPAPLNLPVIVPLAPAEMPNVFTPPAALNPGDLHVKQPPAPEAKSSSQKPPAPDAKERAQGRRILAHVADRYSTTRRAAETMHQALIQRGAAAVRALVDAYYQVALQIPGILIGADSQLQSSFDAATSQVISAADSADQEIVRQFNQAKRTLGGALGSGLKAVKANAESASQQITTILTTLSSGYVKILSDASLEGEMKSLEAYDAIEKWKINFNTNYPVTPSFGKVGAMAEAWQKVVPKLGNESMGRLSAATIEYQSSFTENTKQVQTDISNSVKPTLQQHADKIGTEGVKNVTDAHSTALDGLRRQTRAARDAIAGMRSSTIQQLDARRQAVRTSLEVEAQQVMAAARHEASTAVQTVSTSLDQSLPYYATSVERFHTMLVDAKDVPPESLQAMADGAAPSVLESLNDAGEMQAAQLETVTTNVQRSVASRASDLYSSLTVKVFDAANEMQTRAFETANSLNQTAENMTAGFSAVANGVNAAAQSWSMPLSKAFEGFIEANQKELDKNKEAFQERVDKSKKGFLDWVQPQSIPSKFFEKSLDEAWTKVYERLTRRLEELSKSLHAGILNKIDEGGVTGALRGLTAAQGYAMRYEWEVERGNGSLELTLLYALDEGTDDYNAAMSYLNGNTALGAKYELEASMHWYNDEEDRIKAVMRSLTPEQLKELHKLDGWAETKEDVREALDETDLDINVFDALDAGDHFLAQAFEEKDAIDSARKSGNEDALNERLAALSIKPDPEQYGGMELTGEQRREGVERAFASMQGQTLNANGQPLTQVEAADVMLAYATRPIEMIRPSGGIEGGYETYTSTVGERQTELARALLHQGEGSVEARAARVVVELNRPGGAKILNLDTALYDARLDPSNPDIKPEQRQEAQAEHDRMLQLAAENYARMSLPGQSAKEAKSILVQGLQKGHTPGSSGARLGEALINEPYPTPATAAIAMEYGMEGSGTKEELLNRFTGRMNRDEIQEMRKIYDKDGGDIYAELGIFGHGTLGELSGDDRLQMERNFIGVPRNDKERYEAAQFALQQQQNETGLVGGFLSSGSYQERSLNYNQARMNRIGGRVIFKDGVPKAADKNDDYTKKFDDKGNFKGDAAEFGGAVLGSTLSAQNYAAKVDQWANFVANAIAIAGMVVAAVVTVATAGMASPLLLGAIALGTGLLAVGANYAIKGGRYGWEQAFTDVGMAAVQALTAGLGQKLSLVAKAGKLTSSGFANKLIIGAATSALNSVGQTALSEQTYEKGAGGAADELLFSLFRGATVGAVTTTATHGLESLKVGPKLPGQNGQRMKFGDLYGESTSHTTRAAGKALTSGVSGFVGKETELGLEAARGRYKGDMGDSFVAGVEAGLQNALQSTAEGVGEAHAQRRFNAPNPPPPTPTQPAAQTTAQPDPTTTGQPRPITAGEPETSTVPRPTGEPETSTVPRPAGEEAEPAMRAPLAEPTTAAAPDLPVVTTARPAAPTPSEAAPMRVAPTPEAGEGGGGIPRQPVSGGGDDGEGGRRPSPGEARTNEILEVMLTEIQQKRQMAGGKLVDDEFERLPEPLEPALRGGEGTADRTTVSDRVAGSLRSRARRAFGRALQEALADPSKHTALTQKTQEYLLDRPDQIDFVLRTGRLPGGFDFDHFLTVADFPEFAHRPDVGAALPKDVHREAAHGGDTTKPREAATMRDPEAETRPPFHVDTEAADTPDPRLKPLQQQIAEGLATSGDIDTDNLITQRAELAQMQASATAARNADRPDAALERRIDTQQAGIDKLEQQIAARPAAEAPAGDVSGTAAGIEGSRFRGDALEKPRADIGEDVKTAVGILVKEGSTAKFITPTDDPNVVEVEPLTGKDKVTVRIVPTDTMLPEADGLVPVARFRHNPATGEYDVLVSSRAPKDAIERALAHELTEIRSAHKQGYLPDALKPGGFGAANDTSQTAKLSHHDRGRLAELGVLARQIEAATKSNDQKKLLQLHEDTQQLLAHLGVIEETSGARARLEVVQGEVDDKPVVRKLVDDQVEAAKKNPFLLVIPAKAKARDYAELLLDQLDYAMRLGNQARVEQVMKKALATAYLAENNKNIMFELDSLAARSLPSKERPSNHQSYNIAQIRSIAADPNNQHNRRAKALVLVIDKVMSLNINEQLKLKNAPRRSALELAASDPEYAAIVHRRYGDTKLSQDWQTFQQKYLNPKNKTPEAKLQAFGLWASGKYAKGIAQKASVESPDRSPNIEALPYMEMEAPIFQLPHGTPQEAELQKVIKLLADLEEAGGIAEREAISEELKKLPTLTRASENLGVATAKRAVEAVFHINPDTLESRRGSGVPDLMFDAPSSDMLLVIEAKGGEGPLGTRKKIGSDEMVEQGTLEYLQSLSKAMQRSKDTKIQEQGEKLETALREKKVVYVLVRQQYDRETGALAVPTVAIFDISKGGKKVKK